MKSALLILEAAGFEASDEQMSQLARVLNGLAFSNITFTADQPGTGDQAGLIDRLLNSVLD
jgi:hypothetical protein